MEATLSKLGKRIYKEVPGINATVAQLIMGVITVIGCFSLMIVKPDSADAALSILSIVAGFYFGRSQSPPKNPPSEPEGNG